MSTVFEALRPEQMHFTAPTGTFADVILPVAVPKAFTYYVDEKLLDQLAFGMRVEVQFGGNKLYSGIVSRIHQEKPQDYDPKPILNIIDAEPVIDEKQLQFWVWLSQYYACTIGEVMNAALPANLKLSSETRVCLSPDFDGDMSELDENEYLIAEALTLQEEIKLDDVRKILGQYSVYPVINRLLARGLLYLREEMLEKYKPKIQRCVRLASPYRNQPEMLSEAFENLSRSNRQVETLMALVQLSRKQDHVSRQQVQELAGVDSSVLRALEAKNIFELYEREVSRIDAYGNETDEVSPVSEEQKQALSQLSDLFREKDIVLLHGVTGSGKTRVYIELIQAALARGEQVLYLLPEIALTTQVVLRLKRLFGDHIAVYHSKLNTNERVEIYRSASSGMPVLLGARSALFLPFRNLKWIIVDEEHDPSYKQQDPAPRYNGRDAAIYLSRIHGAKVLLGSATPSVESYFNVRQGKYGLVEMSSRYGGNPLPELSFIDLKEASNAKQMQSHFSQALLDAIRQTVASGQQVILFQNRRGYAPTLRCAACAWTSECIHCDVTLTYHKHRHKLQCHYCGYQKEVLKACPACHSTKLQMQGFGTEKIEDDLKVYLPELRISRLDFDTVKGKNALTRIIEDFEGRQVDVMIGTQMVTKGLDFDNVGLVGVLNADLLLSFPDFRASERGFQLLTQVSGRSGRGKDRGRVLVQTYHPEHPVLQEVLHQDMQGFFNREFEERQQFRYPPYQRLIVSTLKHKKAASVNEAARLYTHYLRQRLGDRVIGPAIPHVGRVRNWFLLDTTLKLEKDPKMLAYAKTLLAEAEAEVLREPGLSQVRINVDVDPM